MPCLWAATAPWLPPSKSAKAPTSVLPRASPRMFLKIRSRSPAPARSPKKAGLKPNARSSRPPGRHNHTTAEPIRDTYVQEWTQPDIEPTLRASASLRKRKSSIHKWCRVPHPSALFALGWDSTPLHPLVFFRVQACSVDVTNDAGPSRPVPRTRSKAVPESSSEIKPPG
jgi:hypothetical protein